jgi:hypothetical protein
VLAGRDVSQEGRAVGGHAGAERECGLGVFEVGQFAFQGADGGVEAVSGDVRSPHGPEVLVNVDLLDEDLVDSVHSWSERSSGMLSRTGRFANLV